MKRPSNFATMNTTEQKLKARVQELRMRVRFWRRIAAMLGTLLLACAIVIVLAYFKLP